MSMSISLDGYFEGPNREIDWHLVDAELHAHFNTELRTMGAFLDGRITYQLMAGYWPTADQAPGASKEEAEFARIWRDMPKIVYSRTLQQADWNTEIRREVDPAEVRAMKAQPGGDMALGGAELAGAFRQLDLIDEYCLYVHPVLLGSGRRLFGSAAAVTPLRLVESRQFGNGVQLLRYQPTYQPAGTSG